MTAQNILFLHRTNCRPKKFVKWRLTAEPTTGMTQFLQILRRSPDHAVSDHKGDLEIYPSLDWKPVEIIANANGSRYVVEFEDVQDQPSGQVGENSKLGITTRSFHREAVNNNNKTVRLTCNASPSKTTLMYGEGRVPSKLVASNIKFINIYYIWPRPYAELAFCL